MHRNITNLALFLQRLLHGAAANEGASFCQETFETIWVAAAFFYLFLSFAEKRIWQAAVAMAGSI